MNSEKCPYCEKENKINHDDGYGYEEDVVHQQQCGHCDKYFTYTTSISYYYDVSKADCLNGSEHKWVVNTGCSPGYLSNFHTCEECAEREQIDKTKKYNSKTDTWVV